MAFHDVFFEVGYEEAFGFLGPNGAGKTSMVCTAPRHRLGRMLISEAFLLLVTTEDGKWLASSPAVPIALAGGLLAELAANGRAAVDDRGRLAPPADPSPLGDPILDQALETFRQNVGKKPKDVLGTVAKGLGDELYERLATAGIVEIHRGRFLRPNRFPPSTPFRRLSPRSRDPSRPRPSKLRPWPRRNRSKLRPPSSPRRNRCPRLKSWHRPSNRFLLLRR